MSVSKGRRVAVIGAGGNIGSHLVAHLARTREISGITLVDPDVYEAKNIASQSVARRDVGRPKVDVQVERLREIAEGSDETVDLVALASAIDDVPLGMLRVDLLLACLDSRIARQSVNEIAWRLGIPWIDAGVRAEGLLTRLNVYVPGPDQPCLECAWDDRDYAALEMEYPCGAETTAAPTNAPSALGALAAALQMLECQKILASQWDDVAVGRQVTQTALAHRHYVTSFRASSECRFDHQVWAIDVVDRAPDTMTLGEAAAIAGVPDDADTSPSLGMRGQVFVRALTCPACGTTRDFDLHVLRRLPARIRRCGECGTTMRAPGSDVVEWLGRDAVPPALRDVPLAALGIAAGDVVSIRTSDRTTHHQIGAMR